MSCLSLFQAGPREWRPLLIVVLNTGLRKTEQLSLIWEDIDFQNGLIRVRRSKSGRPRYVPMSPIVIETLKSIPRMIDNPFVFYGHIQGNRLKDVP
jgi:integrase